MKKPPQDLDSELVWWPWAEQDRRAGTSRLGRPWRAIFLVLAQVVLIWGVLALGRKLDERPAPEIPPAQVISELRSRSLLVPVVGVERSELRGSFGDPRGTRRHLGMDIAAPRHRPIVAVEAGQISRITTGRLSGLAIHQLSADGQFSYFYAHLESVAEGLEEGDPVRAGEVLGTVGSSGNAASPHLHFGIKRLDEPGQRASGRDLDPFAVFRP